MALDPAAPPGSHHDEAVRARYGAAAARREAALCCPVEYDPRYLEVIPPEVLERDYGCGDPSRYVREGDTVLDLGSGGGKICFIAAQIAGPTGRVIGIDANEEMLALARKAQPDVARALGYENVEFRRGRIQELDLDLDALEAWLGEHPVRDVASLAALESHEQDPAAGGAARAGRERRPRGLELRAQPRARGGQEPPGPRDLPRAASVGGRIAISDIVSDEPVPDALKADPELLERLRLRRLPGARAAGRARGGGLPRHPHRDLGRRALRGGGGNRVPLGHRDRAQGQAGPLLRDEPGRRLPRALAAGRGRRRPRARARRADGSVREDLPPSHLRALRCRDPPRAVPRAAVADRRGASPSTARARACAIRARRRARHYRETEAPACGPGESCC